MNSRRISALAAAVLVLGAGIATAPAANAYTCSKINGIGTNWAYIKDQNSACGTVGARHQFTPTPGVITWTAWVYDADYARSGTAATLIKGDWSWSEG